VHYAVFHITQFPLCFTHFMAFFIKICVCTHNTIDSGLVIPLSGVRALCDTLSLQS